jgi:dTDP-4-amino-4,6-dideoxygalactose transaminase
MTPTISHAEFELARLAGRAHAVLTGNGTTALWASLSALELPAGAPVVYPDITCETAVNAAIFAGLTPVFADVGAVTAAPTADQLAATARTARAHAVVPTHIFGRVDPRPVPIDLPTVVDAAQSQVTHASLRAGTLAVLSFGPGKQLDLGGGGAVFTDDARLADSVRELVSTLPADPDTAEAERGELTLGLVDLGRRHPEGSRAHANGRSDLLRTHRLGFLCAPAADLPSRLRNALPGHARAVQRQRAVARLLRERLGAIPGVQALDLGPLDAPWRLTFQIAVGRDAAASALTRGGLRVSRLFPPVHRLLGQPDADYPVATALAQRLLNLDLRHLGFEPVIAVDRAEAGLTEAIAQECHHAS